MQTATLGPFTVSRLCLGTMLMGDKTPADESQRMLDRYLDRLLTAAERDPEVAYAFARVIGLLDPAPALLRPRTLGRVALSRA